MNYMNYEGKIEFLVYFLVFSFLMRLWTRLYGISNKDVKS